VKTSVKRRTTSLKTKLDMQKETAKYQHEGHSAARQGVASSSPPMSNSTQAT
jgi:hypothetical protein